MIFRIRTVAAATGLILSGSQPAYAQHQGHTPPDTAAKAAPVSGKKPAAKKKAAPPAAQKKQAAKPKAAPPIAERKPAPKPVNANAPTPKKPIATPRTTTIPAARDTILMPGMVHAMSPGALGISMDRMGSGTTWIPDAVTLPSRHLRARGWDVMLHGFAFLQYISQSGPRGDDQLGSLNWAMIMASRPLAGGHFQFRFMPSIDRAFVGRCGYPLLLQSGETCNGAPLVDRQHPHELFMELAALYERQITPDLAVSLYAAPSGEPALSPVAFMHRPSAMDNPTAPIGHHWQDATHTSFGVLTAGLFTRSLKVEASWFNGREPDENRYDFDRIRLDSYSGRVTLNPNPHWSFTAGYGYLDSPETLHPEESMRRITASAMHGRRFGAEGQWASTFIYGANRHQGDGDHSWSHSLLLESEIVRDSRNTFFGRAELVERNGAELRVPGLDEQNVLRVVQASAGYARDVIAGRGLSLAFGVRGTVGFIPERLGREYGSRNPKGSAVFLRLRPIRQSHARVSGGMDDMKPDHQ